VNGFKEGVTYYAAITAMADSGEESDYSAELVFCNSNVCLGTKLSLDPSAGCPNGSYTSSWEVVSNGFYDVEKSNDLVNWTVISTVNVQNGILDYNTLFSQENQLHSFA